MRRHSHRTNLDSMESLVDKILLKGLPYGKWTTKDNEEYLFNREYDVICGRKIGDTELIPVTIDTWVDGIVEEEFYYQDGEYPTRDKKNFIQCLLILEDWMEAAANKPEVTNNKDTWEEIGHQTKIARSEIRKVINVSKGSLPLKTTGKLAKALHYLDLFRDEAEERMLKEDKTKNTKVFYGEFEE